jgi:hypothetical protein
MVRSQLKPRLIFWRCVDRLIQEKVQLPGCFTLTDLITVAINRRKEILTTILKQQLPAELRDSLEALFEQTPDADAALTPLQSAACTYERIGVRSHIAHLTIRC